ncbi:hypothetical protein NC99_22770 [Sunxiuqinia dokdonensis]|uniref:Uncharacterized protein n=1 Tax=Sunxiuqinia dokdonensis TaxID=1409788 RepID=A0A0L8V8Z8_9BACT|nr:hypothetical protein NC99_22770 [Sunxiuqinia dokdonensis]
MASLNHSGSRLTVARDSQVSSNLASTASFFDWDLLLHEMTTGKAQAINRIRFNFLFMIYNLKISSSLLTDYSRHIFFVLMPLHSK